MSGAASIEQALAVLADGQMKMNSVLIDLVNHVDEMRGEHKTTLTALLGDLTKLRVDMMARMDRLQHTIDLVKDDITGELRLD